MIYIYIQSSTQERHAKGCLDYLSLFVAATFMIMKEPSFGFLKGFWFRHTYKRLFIGRTEIKNMKGLTILILHVPSLA